MKNRLLFIASFLLIFSMQLSAQKYVYLYDNAGNRTTVTLYKSGIVEADTAELQKPVLVMDQGQEFKLYPNPTKGQLTIECQGISDVTKVTCIVHDANGRFVSNATYTGQQTIKFNMSNLPNGLYIFQMKLQDRQYVLKVLKE
jgi:hypothetical protein